MKLFCLIIALFSSACSPAIRQNTPLLSNSNESTALPTSAPLRATDYVVPAEFGKVDFNNFKYPFGTLRDGKLIRDDKPGETTYELNNIYYADLTGDSTKEAIVAVLAVSCGGSYDGGSFSFHVYKGDKLAPKFLGEILSGNTAYGCAVKSFKIEDKKINVWQFGRCVIHHDKPSNKISRKFVIADITNNVYEIENGKLQWKVGDIVPSPEQDVKNYRAQFQIE